MTENFIRRRKVEERTGLARSTIYDLMNRGAFPKPIKLTDKAVAWSEKEIADWLSSRPKVL